MWRQNFKCRVEKRETNINNNKSSSLVVHDIRHTKQTIRKQIRQWGPLEWRAEQYRWWWRRRWWCHQRWWRGRCCHGGSGWPPCRWLVARSGTPPSPRDLPYTCMWVFVEEIRTIKKKEEGKQKKKKNSRIRGKADEYLLHSTALLAPLALRKLLLGPSFTMLTSV